MEINIRNTSGVTIVDLSGRLTAGSSSAALRRTVQDLLNRHTQHILINMHGLDMMDSSGLGELVRAKNEVVQAGAALKLVYVTGRVRQVFELAGKTGAFAMFDDERAAISTF